MVADSSPWSSPRSRANILAWNSHLNHQRPMKNPTSAEVLLTAKVFRRSNQDLNQQAATQTKLRPINDVGVRHANPIKSRVESDTEIVRRNYSFGLINSMRGRTAESCRWNPFYLAHALPLPFGTFSCCARLHANQCACDMVGCIRRFDIRKMNCECDMRRGHLPMLRRSAHRIAASRTAAQLSKLLYQS